MKAVRVEFHRRRTAACPNRLLIRIEQQSEDFIISPLLGEGSLCESCWINRRAATFDATELRAGASSSAELIAAFHDRYAVAARPERPQQRATMAQILREQHQEAQRAKGFRFPPVLSRIPPSGTVVRESVLPLPGCKVCSNQTTSGVTQALAHVVGRAAGIVVQTEQVPSLEGEPAFPHVVVSRLANTFLNPSWPFWSGAAGKGATYDEALATAIGESLERYAARIVSQPLVMARAENLDSAIEPLRLTGVDSSQSQEAGYPVDGEIPWARATYIRDRDRTAWLPASAVYLRLPSAFQKPPVPFASNGLACAPTLDQGIQRALAEVAERHAFFSVWYGVRDAELPNAERFIDDVEVVKAFSTNALELTTALLAAPYHNLVVASASCWPHADAPLRPGFAIGLGVGETPTIAVRRAILEVAQVYRGLTWALRNPFLRQRAEQLHLAPSLVEEPYDHALLFARRRPEAVPAPFGLAPARAAKTRMRRSDVVVDNALFVDLTPKDVCDATGWHVIRVVVPDAFPCHFGVKMIPRAMLHFSACEHAFSTDLLHPLS